MSLNAPYTPNTVIQSTQVSNDLVGLANGSNDTSTNSMSTFRSEATYDFVASGAIWSGDSYGGTRNASMTIGVVYIGGVRVGVGATTGRLFTASKDTYVDSTNGGLVVYTEVTNNSASPALAVGSIRLGIIITGASNIADVGSVNQGQETKILPIASSIAYSVTDSLGNLIYPSDPNRKLLGYRRITSNFTSTTGGAMVDVTGLNCPVIIPSNRKVIVTFHPRFIASTQAAGLAVDAAVNDATSSVQVASDDFTTPVSAYAEKLCPTNIYTPPASGARTFKAQAQQVTGGATLTVAATATAAAFIKVELD